MRIGLVVERFDLLRGGLEQWSGQLAAHLLYRGHEVHAMSTQFCAEVLALPIVAHPVESRGSRTAFAEATERLVRRLELDVVHDTGAGWSCDVFQPHSGSRAAAAEHSLLLAPGWFRPVKRAVDRWLPRRRALDRLLRRQYLDDGRLLLALSQRVARDFQDFHGVSPDRIRLVYNGVDTGRFSPQHRAQFRQIVRAQLGVSDETRVLLIVAHNFRLKGVPILLRAVACLARRRWPVHLVVVGGRHVGAYRRLAWVHGAAGRVTFTGTVRNTVPYYAAADVYVHPTFHDACSLVVLEALASGLPVITSAYNGASELMQDGREGFILSDPADLDELLARLEALWDRTTQARMGLAARRLALEHSFQRNVEEILAVYEEARHRRAARAALPDRVAISLAQEPNGPVQTTRRAVDHDQSP